MLLPKCNDQNGIFLSKVRARAKKFGTKEATFTAFETLYSLAQCTPDLSGADCYRCLKIAIASLPSCCRGKQLGLVQSPSCNVKYAVSPFYQIPNEQLDPESPITPKGNFYDIIRYYKFK